MKVIDLLNKIANGEEVPKKVKYLNQIFELTNNKVDWYCYDYNINLLGNEIGLQQLNDTIEILEEPSEYCLDGRLLNKNITIEPKGIPEKLSTWYSVEEKQSLEENCEFANCNFETMYDKINEIIDYLESKGD